MATDDYNRDYNNNSSSYSDMHHLRRDARDAHSNATLAKWLAILALIVAAVALTVAGLAMDRASDAQGTANRAIDSVQSRQ